MHTDHFCTMQSLLKCVQYFNTPKKKTCNKSEKLNLTYLLKLEVHMAIFFNNQAYALT